METKITSTLAGALVLVLAWSACGNARRPMNTPISTNTGPSPTMTPIVEPPITVENADKVQWLRTMDIPDYNKGQISQCSLTFSPDGRWLVGACGRNQVPVWDVQSGRVRQLLYENPPQIVACTFSPSGASIACGGFDKTITLWNPETGKKIRDLGSHDSPIWDIDFSPDGHKLISCGLADDIRLWDVERGETIWSYAGAKACLSVAFSPSGKTIAYGGRWGNAGVVDVATGKSITELVKLANPIGDVTFSPTGKLLAAGTDDNLVYLWETENYQHVATLEGHRGYVNGVSFSPVAGETLLASGSHDKTLAIWDIAGQRRLKTLEGHTDAVLRVAFSPAERGTLIASISWDGTVRLWGVPGK